MRSVRCDVCGAKALTAASSCPKCGQLFELRDGFGKLLPLVYCVTCDAYYPEHLGRCRWCGSQPVPAPKLPHVLKGVGVVALVGLGTGLWFARRDASTDGAPAPVVVAKAQAVAPLSGEMVGSPVAPTRAD